MSQYIYIGIQIAATILGFVTLFFIMYKEKVKDKDILVTAIIAGIIGCMGYLLQLLSHAHWDSLLAMQISFFGKCFVVTLMLLFVGRYFGILTGRRWYRLLIIADTVSLVVIFTCEYHGLFYQDISFSEKMHFENVTLGPLYVCYMAYQMLKLICFIYCINVCMKKNKIKSLELNLCMVFSGLILIAGIGLLAMNFKKGFDITSLSYSVMLFFLAKGIVKLGAVDTVEEAQRNAVNNMTDGMMVVDNNLELLYENRTAKEIFSNYDRYSPKVRKRVRETLIKGEHETYHNGNRMYETRTTPLGEGTREKGYMILIIDVTEREKQKQEIMNLKTEAENASKAKSQFLGSISNEFRKPMNTIRGMTEILQNADLAASERANLEQLKQATDKLQRMLNDVLDYSKIDLGKMNLIQVEYPLQELVRRVYQNMEKKASQKSLEFIVEIAEDMPRAYFGDDLKVQQILEAIIGNAIKFTPKGQILLKISGEAGKKDDYKLIFQIQDTGNGIQREYHERIFEVFEEEDEKRSDGMGLGLALAKKLAALMGGDITFSSTYGIGSEFVVSIYQKVVDAEPLEQGELYQKEELIPNFTAPKAVVAVIDDSPINLKVAEHALHYYQMRIQLFQSGEEFIEEVEKGLSVDLILMDQMMPGLDGKETLKLYRTYNQTTPVVLLSSNAIEGVREEMLEAGFSECVFKPVREGKLKEMLYRELPKEKIVLYKNAEEAEELDEDKDAEYLKNRIGRLESCLEYYDLVKAQRILEELEQGVIGSEIREVLKEVEKCIDNRDFEKALRKVKKLEANWIELSDRF